MLLQEVEGLGGCPLEAMERLRSLRWAVTLHNDQQPGPSMYWIRELMPGATLVAGRASAFVVWKGVMWRLRGGSVNGLVLYVCDVIDGIVGS
jgi:hypothetical protein